MRRLVQLGALLVKILIRSKVKNEIRENFIDIASALEVLGVEMYEARDIDRAFSKIGDNIAASCKKVLVKTKVKEERIDAIIENVMLAYQNVEMNLEELLEMQFDEEKLKRKLLSENKAYKDNLDPEEIELYERMLEHTSHIMFNAYIKLPEFNEEGIKRLNVKVDEITDKIDDLLEQMERVNKLVDDKSVKVRNFERQYRNNVVSSYNYINLFGAGGIEREYRKYPLSIAYVELEFYDDYNEKHIILVNLFKKKKNIWLCGEAGSGKTTLLQWIAVNAAQNTQEIDGIRDTIPVFIKLRQVDCSNLSLKRSIQHIMRNSSYEIPENWIEESIETGRMIFLIDGFDEINEQDRQNVLSWLEEIDAENKCKKIFTARPQVKERPVYSDLLEVKLLPMNRSRIKTFVEYWNKAVLEEQLKVDGEEAEKISAKLNEKIRQSESLFKLASSPLLCAMICALHYRNDLRLPANKRELYEECCKMLIENRDIERGIRYPEVKLELSYEKKKIILAQLAYWMMKNKQVEVKREAAEGVVNRAINGMESKGEADIEKIVFKYLLERCGILREPEEGKIDFVHRTFQEYLTAYEISRNEDWGYIKEKIGDTTWQETIEMSIGYAKKAVATDLIQETLNKGRVMEDEKKYLFVAISFLTGAIEISKTVRIEVEKRVSELIPPQHKDCHSLAAVGDLVVPYLVNTKEYGYKERVSCIRVLRMIASTKTLEVIKSYFDQNLSNHELVEIGRLLEQFTNKELLDNGIVEVIKKYIQNQESDTIVLSEGMLRALNSLEEDEAMGLFGNNIIKFSLLDYSNDILIKWPNIFRNICELSIYGDFVRADILKCFLGLKRLAIHSRSSFFSIYHLNTFQNIYSMDQFYLSSHKEEYINGRDLNFLRNVKSLHLKFLNRFTEISFEAFDCLSNLKELAIGAEFTDELDYGTIPDSLEKLIVRVPKEYMEATKYEVISRVNSSIEVQIQEWK